MDTFVYRILTSRNRDARVPLALYGCSRPVPAECLEIRVLHSFKILGNSRSRDTFWLLSTSTPLSLGYSRPVKSSRSPFDSSLLRGFRYRLLTELEGYSNSAVPSRRPQAPLKQFVATTGQYM